MGWLAADGSLAIRIDEEDGDLIHARDMPSNHPGKPVAQQRLRSWPSPVAQSRRMIANIKKGLMLTSMACA
jgi:hypothetical protein